MDVRIKEKTYFLAEWELFKKQGSLPEPIRPVVKEAWLEAREAHPGNMETPSAIKLSRKHLLELRAKEKELIDTFHSRIRRNTKETHGRDFQFLLFNPHMILMERSSSENLPGTDPLELVPGSLLGFCFHSHTAFTLALKKGEAVYLREGEHYLSAYHPFTTFAVPLLHPEEKRIMAVLGMITSQRIPPEIGLCTLLSLKQNIEENYRFRFFNESHINLIREVIIQKVDHGVVIIDPEGKIADRNKAAVQLFQREIPTGMTIKDFVEGYLSIPFEKSYLYRGLIHGEESKNIEKWIHSGGDKRCLLIDTMVVEDPFDSSRHWTIEIMKDITKKKERDELWARREKMISLGRLAAGIAHEIRNPLTTVKGFFQLLGEKISEKEYLSLVEKELNRISELIAQFVLLSKPDSPHLSRHSVYNLLSHFITWIRQEASRHHIEVELIYPDDEGELIVEADPNQMTQLFLNLTRNAFQAMGEGGKLTVHVLKKREGVEVSFIDRGKGIPAHLLPKVTEPFFTTKEEGTGLGLSICYQIVEVHGGKMEIESEEGVGTTVRILLPLATKGASSND